jgi:diacylglycerol diphosphate phosphatase / phosphatidate phosphatase
MEPPLSERPGLLGAVVRIYQRTYLGDYIGFLLLQLSYQLTRFFITPAHRQFSLSDPAIQHPFAEVQRVSSWENVIYAGFVPLGILVVWSLVTRSSLHKAHVTVLGLLISVSLTSFLTHVVKNAIGRPRPDLIDRCQPALGTPGEGWVGFDVCTQTDRTKLEDGWRSFPSGHSSFAFSGLCYLSLWLAGQLHTWRPAADLARVLVTIAPLVGAMLIAMSRMSDYRHDVYDVSAGSLLGIVVSSFTYRRYFRSPRDRLCHEPWPSPLSDVSARRGNERPRSPKDEEEEIGTGDFDLDDLTEDEAERGLLDRSKSPARGKGVSRPGGEAGTSVTAL